MYRLLPSLKERRTFKDSVHLKLCDEKKKKTATEDFLPQNKSTAMLKTFMNEV